MTDLWIAGLAFAPGAFWLWYFYRKDKWEPEPKRLVLRTYLLGLFVAAPVSFIAEMLLYQPGRTMVLVIAPVVEELFKLLIVRYTIFRNAEFDEPMDGIVYAASAALGFASIENAEYLITELHRTGSGVYPLSVVRAFLSVPGHVLFSAMWGYGLGWAKFLKTRGGTPSSNPRTRITVFGGYLLAVGLHALFNLAATVFGLAALVVVSVAFWVAVRRMIVRALRSSPYVRK